MEKIIRDGKVGVLISTGWGAGFSSWGFPLEAVFSPTLIDMVEREDWDSAVEYCETNWKGNYCGGIFDLEVCWVQEGRKFQITEYDGAETIEFEDEMHWITA